MSILTEKQIEQVKNMVLDFLITNQKSKEIRFQYTTPQDLVAAIHQHTNLCLKELQTIESIEKYGIKELTFFVDSILQNNILYFEPEYISVTDFL